MDIEPDTDQQIKQHALLRAASYSTNRNKRCSDPSSLENKFENL